MTKCNLTQAFSLVELVIVIVILGVLTAIAIPRISSGSIGAGEAALKSNLQTLRDAIDRYACEHNNYYPAARPDGVNAKKTQEAFVNQLTQYSNAAGEVSAGKDAAFPFGPYLRRGVPALSVGLYAGINGVKIEDDGEPLVAEPDDNYGWVYNITTGQFIANATEAGSDGRIYDSY